MISNPYNKSFISRSKKLRRDSTLGEKLLWKYLKNKQILNIRFRRQHPLLNYIADFYSIELKLVIEIDGLSHVDNKQAYDSNRQKELENIGCKVLRFSEYEVTEKLDEVLEKIHGKIKELTATTSLQPLQLWRGSNSSKISSFVVYIN